MRAGLVYSIALGVLVALAPWAGTDGPTASAAQASAAGPANEPYSLSFAAGKRDARGNFLGGTELMNLVAFEGKLYAGLGYWMDRPEEFSSNDPRSAAQVLVLDSKQSRWRQDYAFNERNEEDGFKHHRLSTMQVISFHRFDNAGQIVGSLADLLVVGLDSPSGAVYTQMGAGQWQDTMIPTDTPVRSLAVHYDATDRTEKVYAGPGGSLDRDLDKAIYSGVYDPSAPGKIRWDTTPERTGIQSRVMSMVDCGGVLFAAAKPSIFRRNDATKRWETVYSNPMQDEFDQTKFASGFRGLTCLDDPASGRKTLLSGFESYSGDIVNVDPETGKATTELRSRQFLTEQWGSGPAKPDIIAGYNDLPLVQSDPDVRLFSMLARSPNENEDNSAWFMSRTAGSPPSYQLHQVNALRWPNRRSDASLWSVRTIALSPFPEDQGKVMYMGGYDGHFQPVHNTAWVYRVGVGTALRPYTNAGQ